MVGMSAIIVGLILAAGASAGQLVDRVAAVVNGEIILLSEVLARAGVQVALPPQELEDFQKRLLQQALEQLIDERLLGQKVQEHRIRVSDEEVDGQVEWIRKRNNLTPEQFAEALKVEGQTMEGLRRSLRSQMEQQKLLELQLRDNPELRARMQVSEAEVENAYQAQYGGEAAKEMIHARHILIRLLPGANAEQKQAALKKAQEVLNKLRGGEPFERLAAEYSDDPSGSAGGDLGWFRRGDLMEDFERVAFTIKEGTVSEPFLTSVGYHIVEVLERKVEGPPDRDKVMEQIRSRLAREKFQQALDTWVKMLREQAYLDIKL